MVWVGVVYVLLRSGHKIANAKRIHSVVGWLYGGEGLWWWSGCVIGVVDNINLINGSGVIFIKTK